MITGNYFVVLVCVLLSYNVIEGQLTCSEAEGCTCHNTDQKDTKAKTQVRCENAEKLSDVSLATFGAGVSGAWDILYINNTGLEKINSKTFEHASFNKIFIERNSKLTSIAADSFLVLDKTEILQIRENPKLDGSTIFDIAKKFGKALKRIWFDKNKIASIPGGVLVGDKTSDVFQNLEVIGIDSQIGADKEALTEIPTNFISNLPSLRQVSLDTNKIVAIGEGAINLKMSKAAPPAHVSIFLNKNPGLLGTQITNKQIIMPDDANTPVVLDLEETGIKDFSGDFVTLLSSIAAKGSVYLRGTSIETCTCADVTKAKLTEMKNIYGIDETNMKCDNIANKKIKDCK